MLKLSTCATLQLPVGDAPQDLRARLKAETGLSVRRTNRFIELALLGAGACRRAAGHEFPANTALYLCMDAGMVTDTARVMQAQARERRAPTPFEFMNISGSMAGFQVAQMLGLQGPQLSLHRNHASLEAALDLLRLRSAPHRQTLVGFVEEGVWPLHEQRQRLNWSGAMWECSHWLYFDADCAAPLATLEPPREYADWESLLADAPQYLTPYTQVAITLENRSTEEGASLAAQLKLPLYQAPGITGPAYCGGLPAGVLAAFVQAQPARHLLHLNRNAAGVWRLIVLNLA